MSDLLAASASARSSREVTVESSARGGRRILAKLRRDRLGMIGAVFVFIAVFAALFGPIIAPYSPTAIITAPLHAPDSAHWLGTDELGRDELSRALYGARVSVEVGVFVTLAAAIIGVSIGIISGYRRGATDGILMRLMDILFAFPTLLLAMAVVAVLGPNFRNLLIAMTVVYVPALARVARASTLSVVEEPYVEAARALGLSSRRIMIRHVLPNILTPVLVQATITVAYAILVEASLSYIGLGIQPPAPSWGSMLSTGQPYLQSAPWVCIVPGVAILITVLGFNLLGDALRDALDPRL